VSSATVNYRLRIRNVADSSDALVLTSVRGGTNPVVAEAPSGDGQELDPVNSTVRTGQYTFRFVDPVIPASSPPSRVITSQLFDSAGRQLLLSRRAYIEQSTDGGSTWLGLVAGYTMGYRLTDAITWEFSIGDTRRIEQTKQVFDGTSTTFAQRGCLFGGPINGGTWGPINDRGGWKFRVSNVIAPIAGQFSGQVGYQFVSGYKGINDPVTTRWTDLTNGAAQSVVAMVNQAAQSYAVPSLPQVPVAAGYYGSIPPAWGAAGFPGITLRIAELVGGANNGLFIAGRVTGLGVNDVPEILLSQPNAPQTLTMYVPWPPGLSMPTVGDIHTISCYTAVPSDASPVYLDLHPVDIVTGLYTDAGIPYDATAAANLKTLLGSTLRVAMRITSPQTLLDFLEQSVFGPFGFSARTNGAGVAQLFATRLKQSTLPTTTIGTNDLQDASGTVFDNEEQTVVSIVRFKSKIFWAYNPNTQTDTSSRPLDSVFASDSEVRVINNDPGVAYSTQEVVYEIPGLIHDTAGLAQDMNAYTSAIALELFDRFGRGGPVCDALAVLAASDTGFQIGDEIYVEPAHFPNLNYRFGDNPSVVARIMQVLRRTETPAGPIVKVIDAGSDQQPVTPAATISIAANAQAPRSVAQFTITNAAAINTAATLVVAVQWATGAGSPTNGVDFARYGAGACPTAAIQLPAVTPGSKVWARARTETPGLRPSAWTSWVSVTLTAVAVPTGLSFSPIYQNAALFNWTNANATDAIDVYVYQGGSPPADWTPYFVCTLQPGSTSCLVRNLNGPSITYQGAVFHRDLLTGKIGAVLTGTFTTNSTPVATSPTPLGMEILPTTQDASLQTGVVLALYPADPVYDILIQRAPDVAGSPGTFTTIAQIGGDTQVFVDFLPNDGVKRWYKIAQVLSSSTLSAFVAPLSAVPGGCARIYVRPPFTNPTLQVVIAQISSVGSATTFSVTVLDPQGGGGTCTVTPSWSGLTSLIDLSTGLPAAPYTATIGVARNFQANLSAPLTGAGYAQFKATEVGRYDGYGYFFSGSAQQNAPPTSSIAIAPPVGFATTALASAFVSGPNNAASILWLASTSSAAAVSRANVIASGASLSSGAPVFTIADLGVALALGDTVYLGVVYYDALGNPQTYELSQAKRFNAAGSRTTRYNASAFFLPVADTNTEGYSILAWAYAPLGHRTATGTGTPDAHYCPLPAPQGATLNAVRLRVGCAQTFSQIAMLLYRNESDGSSTQLGTTQTQTAGGYATLQVGSLTEAVSSSRSYQILAQTLYDSAHANIYGDTIEWFELDISFPSVVTNL
jgi:hypothetical protein